VTHAQPPEWKKELSFVTNLMRDLSTQTDPQQAAIMYGKRLREGFLQTDGWIALSRRGLEPPQYRITAAPTGNSLSIRGAARSIAALERRPARRAA